MNLRIVYTILFLCLSLTNSSAQKFYNLTAKEVRVDSVKPVFCHTETLPRNFSDSTYNVEIVYPEYADMPRADIDNYRRITTVLPPAMPHIETNIVMSRKQPSLSTSFCPVVFRDGKYQVLASFMLRRTAKPINSTTNRTSSLNATTRAAVLADTRNVAPADRYVKHSVLASGKWAKIRVKESGFHQITDALVRQAGFSNTSKVKIYGYGGNLQNEVLNADDLIKCDDMKELPTANVGGKRVFYALGPVAWAGHGTTRTRNPYSDYGYYFLTESDTEPQYTSIDSLRDANSDIYDSYQLHEVDAYSYQQGGRNLFDSREVATGDSLVVEFDNSQFDQSAQYRPTIAIASSGSTTVSVSVNGQSLGNISISGNSSEYIKGYRTVKAFQQYMQRNTTGNKERVTLRVDYGSPIRLDYVQLEWNKPRTTDPTTATLPTPEYIYNITNQDHHADPQADMVIIIPTSQKLLAQAERVKKFHEEHDSMRVNIVPADELFNEFSSGTPDASAYRHYLKMLYDRATSEADMPKYLLLFGGSVWDNRINTSECKQFSADDLLLAYESEESFDARSCYVNDGFYTMLDDGEGNKPLRVDKEDVAVGRFPVTTVEDAKTMVDKLIAYNNGSNKGAWLNTIMFMGDDGDNNLHMNDANTVADQVAKAHPGYTVKKVMWDAYQRESTASGNTYPEVSRIIKQQQKQGALVMNYVGHGSEWQFSHENVLKISDFQTFSNTNLPLWVTVGCDFMPFDRLSDNIGMKAVLNNKGGAVALMGSTRTVTSTYNATLNRAFMRHLLTYDSNGKPIGVGEALRRAKNETPTTSSELAVNSIQFALLGDPAMSLNLPTASISIDSICGVLTSDSRLTAQMKAGALVNVKGHIDGLPSFNGEMTLTVRDCKETVTCRDNDGSATNPFTFTDRTKTIYNGRNTVKDGKFEFEFAVPKDINYSNEPGLISAWAINDDHTTIAQGYSEQFTVGESSIAANDSIGPSIYCYLNSPSFQNGGNVNPTPYFVAEVKDRDGINASGTGIGHDMQLTIDGNMEMTYSLNDNFMFDFGSYTSGSTYYNIPELTEGAHTLQFRAWDIMNNVSTAELRFNVVKSQKPSFSISCTTNPARESTTFIISHDRSGSTLDVTVEVFDMSGRLLWQHNESGTSEGSNYTVAWDLAANNGSRLQTGVYLYRVKLGADGAVRTSKAKKLIVVGNK